MNRPFYKSDKWTLAPGESITVARTADFLVCLDADAEFNIQIDNSPETEFAKGLTYSTTGEFTSVRIVNPSALAITVKMGFGRGGIRDGRMILEGVSIKTEERRGTWSFIGDPIIDTKEEIALPLTAKKLMINAWQYGPYPDEELLIYVNDMPVAFHTLKVNEMVELTDVERLHLQTFGNTMRANIAGFSYVV